MITSLELPNQYIQGPDALKTHMIDKIKKFGHNAFMLCETAVLDTAVDAERDAVDACVKITKALFNGVCTEEESERVFTAAAAASPDCIVGIGGEELLDTAKVVAGQLNLPVIIVPVPVASESSCSNISILYNSRGEVKTYVLLEKNPDVIIVDTKMVAESPSRYLVAAMGCALPALFEAESFRKTGTPKINGFLSPATAYRLGWLCYDTLLDYGLQAKQDNDANQITDSLESVLEASTLLSGVCFSNSGMMVPHTIYNGLTSLAETRSAYHGEKLAISTLATLYLQGEPAEIVNDIFAFCESVGLPVTLDDIGIMDTSDACIRHVAENVCARGIFVQNELIALFPDAVTQALRQVQQEGWRRKLNKKCV